MRELENELNVIVSFLFSGVCCSKLRIQRLVNQQGLKFGPAEPKTVKKCGPQKVAKTNGKVFKSAVRL